MTNVTIYGTVKTKTDVDGSVYRATAAGAKDYENLANLPSLNGELIVGNKTSGDYHIRSADDADNITNVEMYALFSKVFNR